MSSDEREIAERQLRSLLEAQTALRRRAEEVARQARGALERVAEALCPEAVDRVRQGNPAGLATLTPDGIADLVVREVGLRLRRLEIAGAAGQDLERALEEARAQAERLREENVRLRRDLERERAAREAAETRAAALERMAEKAAAPVPFVPTPAPVAPATTSVQTPGDEEGNEEGAAVSAVAAPPLATPARNLPGWIQEWMETPAWERDRLAFWVIGSTGVARRMDASVLVGQAFGVKPGSGSVVRAFDRLKDLGLLEVVEAYAGDMGPAGGKSVWHLFRLTEKGEDAFRLLFGRDPAPGQTSLLLARHKSPEHVLLILATCDLFRAAGWKADPLPDPVFLPDGGRYEPDILAVGPEETLYVECERQTEKNPEDRANKWRRCYEATGGNLVIAVPDRKALETIRSEVLFWLGAQGKNKFRLRMIVVGEASPENLFQFVREVE